MNAETPKWKSELAIDRQLDLSCQLGISLCPHNSGPVQLLVSALRFGLCQRTHTPCLATHNSSLSEPAK